MFFLLCIWLQWQCGKSICIFERLLLWSIMVLSTYGYGPAKIFHFFNYKCWITYFEEFALHCTREVFKKVGIYQKCIKILFSNDLAGWFTYLIYSRWWTLYIRTIRFFVVFNKMNIRRQEVFRWKIDGHFSQKKKKLIP